jgi:hypothetical protein
MMSMAMNVTTMSMEQIKTTGMHILFEHLGPIGMVRFLQQSETGWGDYTKERTEWLEQDSVKNLAEKIIAQRS